MKKGFIILLVTVLCPLVCNAAHPWTDLSDNVSTESLFQQGERVQHQLPLNTDREYTDTHIWCILQSICVINYSTKWPENTTGNISTHPSHSFPLNQPDKLLSHTYCSNNGNSVFIKLHHLII